MVTNRAIATARGPGLALKSFYMPQIVEINDLTDLEPYQLVWRALWQQTPDASFFQSLEWLKVYREHFGARNRLRVLITLSGKEVIGILPLAVVSRRLTSGFARVLSYATAPWLPVTGPVGPNPTATLHAALKHQAGIRRDWDILDLRWPETDRGKTKLAMELAGFAGHVDQSAATPTIDLEGDWQVYLDSRSIRLRDVLRSAEASAAREGELTHERHRPAGAMHADDNPRWDLISESLERPDWRWHASFFGAAGPISGKGGLFRDTHLAATSAGACDLNLLRLNGTAVAAAYNVHHRGSVIGLCAGYDPAKAAWFPDELLLAKMLEDSCHLGDHQIDFVPGQTNHTSAWSTRLCRTARCRHYASSAKGLLLRLRGAVTDAESQFQPKLTNAESQFRPRAVP
jgi:CelD/BcsL family acetyltransferase involved in cellulose biosynthesis